MMPDHSSLELLAPAGNMACLHAAVRAGADAVYLGLDQFNARRGADNFTLETLPEACDYAHLHAARIYLTLNIAIMPDEIDAALRMAGKAWQAGVDAFIVQDIGLARDILRAIPGADVHLSTQVNIHDIDGVHAAYALGASRVTFARELTLAEVAELTEEAHRLGMTTEIFGHGALCICYSGQCFFSSMVGGRSANRGMCAQACRLPYTLIDEDAGEEIPAPGEHLLSPKDLATIDILDKVVATGADSLKIEGRMKSPEYVATVVGVYRKVLERMAQGGPAHPTDDERRALSEAFSRGFTEAYLVGERGNDMMGYGRPNNRGVLLGRVASVEGRIVRLPSKLPLHIGDVLEFWTSKGNFTHTVDDLRLDDEECYVLEVDGRLGRGDRVFRVRDASMSFEDDPWEPRIGLSGTVGLHIGEPLTLDFSAQGTSVHFEGPVVEAARTKSVTAEEVRDHVDRLGNTPYTLTRLDVSLDDGVGIGFSALHKARTQALRRLTDQILSAYRTREAAASLPKRTVSKRSGQSAPKYEVTVCALASNPACARAAKRAGAQTVFVHALNYKRGEATMCARLLDGVDQAGYPGRAVTAMPVVAKQAMNADGDFDPWRYAKPGKPVLVQNFGQVAHGVDAGMEVEVGPNIPVTNQATLDLMAAMGCERVWLSPELTLRQISQLGAHTPIELGLVVCGNQEVMETEHCLLMSQGPCNQKCSTCPRRRSLHVLKDRKGYRFPIITDVCGRSHLYNAVRLDSVHVVPDLIKAGVTSFMVDATLMDQDQTYEAVERVAKAVRFALRDGSKLDKARGCTTGHLFRPVE
jgi:putative protease